MSPFLLSKKEEKKNQVGIQLQVSLTTPIRKSEKGFVWFRELIGWDMENQDMSQGNRKKSK